MITMIWKHTRNLLKSENLKTLARKETLYFSAIFIVQYVVGSILKIGGYGQNRSVNRYLLVLSLLQYRYMQFFRAVRKRARALVWLEPESRCHFSSPAKKITLMRLESFSRCNIIQTNIKNAL